MEKRQKSALSAYRNPDMPTMTDSLMQSAVRGQEIVDSLKVAISPMIRFNEEFHKGISQGILRGVPLFEPHFDSFLTEALQPVSLITSLPSMNSLSETILGIEQTFARAREQMAGLASLMESANLLQQALAEQAARDAEIMDASGFFFRDLLSEDDLLKLFGIEQVDCRVRNAAMTNTLLRVARKEEFAEDLESRFKDTYVLQGRWPIVENAYDAHRSRVYLLAIPALFAQVEGMLVDALVMKEILYVEDNEVFLRSHDPKNPKGGRLKGLSNVADQIKKSDLQEDWNFQIFANYVSDTLAPERNHIMHGQNIDYGKAMLSVKLLLYIWRLATILADQEKSIDPTLTDATNNMH